MMKTQFRPVDIQRVSVNILGERYTIRGEAEVDYIAEVANLVDARMKELKNSSGGRLSKTRLAVLTAINLADEMLQQQRQTQEQKPGVELEERTRRLITLLDEGLIGDLLD